ncbi:MAG: hypothetical protein A3A44_00725 [Candidatus Sungbacteria bacterium RIFCSPLOWO2_01_FULL_60_25]|uniref:CBS domain-containing protein n=1 Tax=Candidatus Sungbacteria bacterium RIFCSPLOWO2_01_FULL_60_25 TaxID=1802281 RepID=A0A1G2LAN8_9BACT|nr:MAG: hypothetical protein A3A44_00725 [Candidatus Sungbacteria bacterium RIFCSPLOWO2_01_FULL_60_25]
MQNKKIQKISVPPTATIRAAMEVMTRSPRLDAAVPAGIVLVTDAARHLLGVVTDGDFRRAIEHGATLEHPVAVAMNAKPFVIVGRLPTAEILELTIAKIRREKWRRDKIRHIIMVDERRRVLDVIYFFDIWRNSEIRFRQIGMVGLGYVGLTLAAALADRGFHVRGFDADASVRATLRRGIPHFYELGLPELLRDHVGRRLEVVNGFDTASRCDMYIIAVGTPVGADHKPVFGPLEAAARTVGRVLKQGDMVMLRSTVPVGTTRRVVMPILERTSGLAAGRDFFVAFAPERTVEGRALEELKRLPQVIGGVDRTSAEIAANIFNAITSYSIILDTLEEAELVKLVNNTYRDVMFAYANELSLIAARWGIDTHKVIAAANRDYGRSQVPMPSPGVGGYCLKKDPFIFIASAREKGYTPILASGARRISDVMVDALAERIFQFLRARKRPIKGSRVCLIGLAFKGEPVTSDLRGSTAIDLARMLIRRGVRVRGYDPAVNPRAVRRFRIQYATGAAAAVRGVDAAVVMNNNPAWKNLPIRRLLARTKRPSLFMDGWGIYAPEEIAKVKHISYQRL